jgi:hypothetical protein
MTASAPACIVYANNTVFGNCATNKVLVNYFAQNPLVTDLFYGAIIGFVVFGAYLGATKWQQKPYGRFLQGWTGIIGIGFTEAGANFIGKITMLTEKLALFDAGRKRFQRIIMVMPESIKTLSQRDGGAAFCLVDLDRRTTVASGPLQWANKAFERLAKTKDWRTFCFQVKLAQIEAERNPPPRFPPLVTLPPEAEIIIPQGSQMLKVKLAQMNDEQRKWYEAQREKEEKYLEERKRTNEQTTLKLQTLLAGHRKYKYDNKTFEVDSIEATAMQREITAQIEGMTDDPLGKIAEGTTVSTMHVASLLRGMPGVQYIQSILEELEKMILSKIKDQWKQYIPLAIIFGIVVVIGVDFGLLTHI